jgi:hypothetical protein
MSNLSTVLNSPRRAQTFGAFTEKIPPADKLLTDFGTKKAFLTESVTCQFQETL